MNFPAVANDKYNMPNVETFWKVSTLGGFKIPTSLQEFLGDEDERMFLNENAVDTSKFRSNRFETKNSSFAGYFKIFNSI